MRRQGVCDIGLALDRVHRVVLAAEHQRRTLDAMQIGEKMIAVALAIGSREPEQHFRPADRAARHVRIACLAEVVRHRQPSPFIERGLAGVTSDHEDMAAHQGAGFGIAKAFEQLDPPRQIFSA